MAGQSNKRRQKLPMLTWFKRKPDPTEAARTLGRLGAYVRKENERAVKRARCEQMCRDGGFPMPKWPS